jgi:hypothetical protein
MFDEFKDEEKFDWQWHRLCGLLFFDTSETGIMFRNNLLTKRIELCGYYKAANGEVNLSDYCPFPLRTFCFIESVILDDFIALRFSCNNGVYIRKIDQSIHTSGPALILGPKMSTPLSVDVVVNIDMNVT